MAHIKKKKEKEDKEYIKKREYKHSKRDILVTKRHIIILKREYKSPKRDILVTKRYKSK